jgi:hypothetical protein
MANLEGAVRTNMSLGADTNSGYEEKTVVDIQGATERAILITDGDTPTMHIEFVSDSDIYYKFDNTATADQISTANSLRWGANPNDPRTRRIPRELGSGIYLHVKQVTSSSAGEEFRYAEL